ncbi:MAG: GerMN domain-containing protein [Spirochaetia bacterium]|nr:GerMN domain-containing protein [Spirochaetia bacterium]
MENNRKDRKAGNGFIYSLIAVVVFAAAYYVVTGTGVLNPNERTISSAMSAYKLYSEGEKKNTVVLFFGDAVSGGYRPVKAEIYSSKLPVNRIKQTLLLLTAGPSAADCRQFLPEGTALKEAYLDPNNILYVDLSTEFASNCRGGTTSEYYAVYSIVNTVMLNFPAVRGVRILVDGAEKKSLAGHIMLESILKPDTDSGDVNI